MKFTPEAGLGDKAELIPNGTLVSAVITINQIKQSQATEGRYLAVELTVSSGEYQNRKIWDMICDPSDERNSDAWRKMGMTALTRAFECAGIFHHDKKETYDAMDGKSIEDIARVLDGMEVVIKVKVEKSSDPAHADKNKVGEWLTPNPRSGGNSGWVKFNQQGKSTGSTPSAAPKFSSPSSVPSPSWLKSPAKKTDLPF
jgi:hypothetical protein